MWRGHRHIPFRPGRNPPNRTLASQALCQWYVADKIKLFPISAGAIARLLGARATKFVQRNDLNFALHNVFAACAKDAQFSP
jgi:hypothetical protein